jgi:uncharacterized membrane protein YidH (DUF202 family)
MWKPKKRYIPTALIVVVFLIGTTIFYIYYENWSILDSILFVVSAITTVGFGYNSPSDDGSRIFTIFVILFGILFVVSSLLKAMYYVLRYIQQQTASTLERLFVYSLLLVVTVLLVGAAVMYKTQKITFITALYFAVETSTTVGFGDIPVNDDMKLFLIFYMIISTCVVAFAFENFRTMRSKIDFRKKKQRLLLNKADFVAIVEEARGSMNDAEFKLNFVESKDCLADIETGSSVENNNRMRVGQYQFVICVLAHLGTINVEKEVVPWLKKFKELDTESTGYLTKEQLSRISVSDSIVDTEVLADETRRRSNTSNNATTAAINNMSRNSSNKVVPTIETTVVE